VGVARARARAELLDQSLRSDLAEPVEVEVASDYADLSARAIEGRADLVWMPPTICARVEPHVRSFYKCQRFGRTTYRSAIVARRGEVLEMSALRGKRFAWVDRLSVGGYLLALETLRKAGIEANDLGAQTFLGSYPEALADVLEKRADAAAITVREDSMSAVREALASYGGKRAIDLLGVVTVTSESPNDALAITKALDARRAQKLERRVFGREGARARAALCLCLEAEGFVRANMGEYEVLRALLR
jgi:phosphonate transport system substrate-binding protein